MIKDVSIVIPLFNEAESLPELHSWIKKVVDENNLSYEIWFINDGSTDESWNVIEALKIKDDNVKGVKFQRNYGKSAGLHTGFQHAEGHVVVTMDADLQDSPEELPGLYKMIIEDGFDLVSGWKQKRYDPITKTLPTKLYNWATRKMSGIELNDFNCGLKAYKYDVIKSIEVYGEMHRYIPLLAKWAGFNKIGEKVVQHQARKYGTTKFGLNRFINGPLDLLSINFVSKFGKRPMHIFGLLGSLLFALGFITGGYLSVDWVFSLMLDMDNYYPITDRPIFYFSLIFMVIGTQLFLAGFIAELLIRNSPVRNNYRISKIID
jgi:glycosyltransferase involved in cell wall biosynthesis